MRIRMLIALAALGLVAGRAAADDVKPIIEKAIKAHGGEENLTKFKAGKMKAKGTMQISGMDVEFSVEAASQLPNQFREVVKVKVMGQEIEVVQVFDGKTGWISQQGQTAEAPEAQLTQLKEQAYGSYVENLVPLLKDKQFTLKSLDEIKVNGKAAVGVLVASKDQKDIKLYFDKDSGELVKSESKSKDPLGMDVNAETFYQNYKAFGPIKEATKVKVLHDGKAFMEAEVVEYKPLEKLDASTFEKP